MIFYLILACTGLYWSYDWWRNGMFKVLGVERPQPEMQTNAGNNRGEGRQGGDRGPRAEGEARGEGRQGGDRGPRAEGEARGEGRQGGDRGPRAEGEARGEGRQGGERGARGEGREETGMNPENISRTGSELGWF